MIPILVLIIVFILSLILSRKEKETGLVFLLIFFSVFLLIKYYFGYEKNIIVSLWVDFTVLGISAHHILKLFFRPKNHVSSIAIKLLILYMWFLLVLIVSVGVQGFNYAIFDSFKKF